MSEIDRVIETAAAEIGVKESPSGSNKTKYGAAYGYNGVPWCVIFLWYCFREAGLSHLFYGGGKVASCSRYRTYAKNNGEWVTGQYRRGDMVIFDFPGTSAETDHIGIITAVTGDSVITIEGNTSATGSQSNGGMVLQKSRPMSQVIGAIRPKYTIEEIKVEEDEEDMTGEEIYNKLNEYLKELPAPEWAKAELQEAIDAGITDGTRPMQMIPRYQAAIMAKRAMEK